MAPEKVKCEQPNLVNVNSEAPCDDARDRQSREFQTLKYTSTRLVLARKHNTLYVRMYVRTYARILRYATLRYVTLRYVTLRYATLRYVTLRYVTLCTYVRTYVRTYARTYVSAPESRQCREDGLYVRTHARTYVRMYIRTYVRNVT